MLEEEDWTLGERNAMAAKQPIYLGTYPVPHNDLDLLAL